MYSLGQAVSYQNFQSDPKSPAILVGFNSANSPIIAVIDKDGVLIRNKQAYSMDVKVVRQKNEKSPSGKSLYYGPFCKKGFTANVTMKLPDDTVLIKELKKIDKLIKES